MLDSRIVIYNYMPEKRKQQHNSWRCLTVICLQRRTWPRYVSVVASYVLSMQLQRSAAYIAAPVGDSARCRPYMGRAGLFIELRENCMNGKGP